MQNYIIIANGTFLAKEIIQEAIRDKTIIALDGAASKLNRLGIKPHIILGDFDSTTDAEKTYWGIEKTFEELNEHDKPYQGNHGVTIVPAKNQHYTDLSKAIHYCDAHEAASITIICAVGGRSDHHEGVTRTLRTEYKKNRPLTLHTEQQTLVFAKDEQVIIHGEIGDKCGVVAFPKGTVTSQGLEYEADHFELEFGFAETTCNSLMQTSATITIEGEALIIMPPQLAAQREFMNKSEIEQLETLLRDAKQL